MRFASAAGLGRIATFDWIEDVTVTTTGSRRILAIMGSGETTAMMIPTHRAIFARLGEDVGAVLLNTPYGFQLNANEISSRIRSYFSDSLGQDLQLADFPSSAVDGLTYETALARLRAARYIFSGPGNATYAFRHWQGTQIPQLLREKLRTGGCITVSSAAALAAGVVTVPVHEIYRMGEDPHWLDGLDLLAEAGMSAAVVPHYDNTDGGTHDTRFSFLGEDRLARMEELLPVGAFILGVDEQTALILDLDEGTASIEGRGSVTVRHAGGSFVLDHATTVATASIIERAHAEDVTPVRSSSHGKPTQPAPPDSLDQVMESQDRMFLAALAREDVPAAVNAVLTLEAAVSDHSQYSVRSPEAEKARTSLRTMLVRLADSGIDHPSVSSLVEVLVDLRSAARARNDWRLADVVRDRLAALGVQIRDDGDRTSWSLPPM